MAGDFPEKLLSVLITERDIVKARVENWRDKTMPAYRGQVERLVQLNRDIERYSLLQQRDNASSAGPHSEEVTKPKARWYESSPEVLRRRQIVLKNPTWSAQSLCKVFDHESIPLPEKWEAKFNVTKWVQAYKYPKARTLIQKMISTDKKEH